MKGSICSWDEVSEWKEGDFESFSQTFVILASQKSLGVDEKMNENENATEKKTESWSEILEWHESFQLQQLSEVLTLILNIWRYNSNPNVL